MQIKDFFPGMPEFTAFFVSEGKKIFPESQEITPGNGTLKIALDYASGERETLDFKLAGERGVACRRLFKNGPRERKIDELGLKAILQIETADGRIADTIRQNTGTKDQTILTMDSLQSVNAGRLAEGVDYLGVMRDNLAALKQALG